MTQVLSVTMEPRMAAAIQDLKQRIQARYPLTEFRVEHGLDAPEAIHLVPIADLEDPLVIADFVLERVLELQIDRGIPIHVIPSRPRSVR